MHPKDFHNKNGLAVSIFHTDAQRETLGSYFRQYGKTLNGLSYFIHRNHPRMLYRKIAHG